jgi:hypothetical protein
MDPDPDPGGPKTHDPTDPDPQHWLVGNLFYGPGADLDLEAAEDEDCPGDGGDGPPDGRRQAREVQDDEHHGAGRGGSQALNTQVAYQSINLLNYLYDRYLCVYSEASSPERPI